MRNRAVTKRQQKQYDTVIFKNSSVQILVIILMSVIIKTCDMTVQTGCWKKIFVQFGTGPTIIYN